MANETAHGLEFFENIYEKWNKPEYIHPDPLEFLHRYKKPEDQETVALIAACLAYGNVKQILKSTEKAVSLIKQSPAEQLDRFTETGLKEACRNFKHRFTTGSELAVFMLNIREARKKYGSLQNLFVKGDIPENETVEQGLYNFINAFNILGRAPSLTPDPALKSSFKRINLFLRWMVRKDSVDTGIWARISPSRLIIPLDTHMRQVALNLGLTKRKDTSMKTALEITAAFRKINPADPVKYDFALTRAGIRGEDD